MKINQGVGSFDSEAKIHNSGATFYRRILHVIPPSEYLILKRTGNSLTINMVFHLSLSQCCGCFLVSTPSAVVTPKLPWRTKHQHTPLTGKKHHIPGCTVCIVLKGRICPACRITGQVSPAVFPNALKQNAVSAQTMATITHFSNKDAEIALKKKKTRIRAHWLK